MRAQARAAPDAVPQLRAIAPDRTQQLRAAAPAPAVTKPATTPMAPAPVRLERHDVLPADARGVRHVQLTHTVSRRPNKRSRKSRTRGCNSGSIASDAPVTPFVGLIQVLLLSGVCR